MTCVDKSAKCLKGFHSFGPINLIPPMCKIGGMKVYRMVILVDAPSRTISLILGAVSKLETKYLPGCNTFTWLVFNELVKQQPVLEITFIQ